MCHIMTLSLTWFSQLCQILWALGPTTDYQLFLWNSVSCSGCETSSKRMKGCMFAAYQYHFVSFIITASFWSNWMEPGRDARKLNSRDRVNMANRATIKYVCVQCKTQTLAQKKTTLTFAYIESIDKVRPQVPCKCFQHFQFKNDHLSPAASLSFWL